VSAPFHCRLLEPAAELMAEALNKVVISSPNPPLICNVSAAATSNPNLVRTLLVQQVTKRVRWREIIKVIQGHEVEAFVEIGTGRVLSNLNKRISKDLLSTSVENPADIDTLLNSL
jgi:[acyl-carrier-protein] S-malonyltransferase